MPQDEQKLPTSRPRKTAWGKLTPTEEIVAALRKEILRNKEPQHDPNEHA